MPKENKSDSVEHGKRVNFIYEALILGISKRDMLHYVSKEKPEWNVSPRMIDNYIHDAREILKSETQEIQSEEFTKAVERLQMLFYLSKKVQDYKTCLAVQRELGLLLGLHKPSKIDHTSKGNEIFPNMTIIMSDITDKERLPNDEKDVQI
jgi:hypothetical protein